MREGALHLDRAFLLLMLLVRVVAKEFVGLWMQPHTTLPRREDRVSTPYPSKASAIKKENLCPYERLPRIQDSCCDGSSPESWDA